MTVADRTSLRNMFCGGCTLLCECCECFFLDLHVPPVPARAWASEMLSKPVLIFLCRGHPNESMPQLLC
jgi:hypothetical protein